MSAQRTVEAPAPASQARVATVPWWRQTKWEARLAFVLFIAPMVLGLTVFTFIPIIWGFLLSFSEAQNTLSLGEFIGFQNYVDMLQNREFRRSLVTILIFTAFIVPLTYAFSLLLAMLVHTAGFGRSFFRTVFFIPTAISYVIASLVWKMGIFNGLPYGFANMVIYWFGIDRVIDWIGTPDPPWYWLVLVTCRLWLQVGFYMIIFLAGLSEIDQSLYEAAYVDGARPGWTTFRTITLPMLANTSVAVLTLNFIAAFQAFDEFYNILAGQMGTAGNIGLARTPLIYLYQVAIGQQDFGRGSAGAFILTFIIIIITLVQGRILGFGNRR